MYIGLEKDDGRTVWSTSRYCTSGRDLGQWRIYFCPNTLQTSWWPLFFGCYMIKPKTEIPVNSILNKKLCPSLGMALLQRERTWLLLHRPQKPKQSQKSRLV